MHKDYQKVDAMLCQKIMSKQHADIACKKRMCLLIVSITHF